jgi:DNA-binding MarR family transcriptional regulator
MKEAYFEAIVMIERLHRLFLEVIKVELDKNKTIDINNVQALILYNIGKNQLTVGELTNRGYYLGSNVSYNLRKMVKFGYVIQVRAPHDGRSSHVKLSQRVLTFIISLTPSLNHKPLNLHHTSVEKLIWVTSMKP